MNTEISLSALTDKASRFAALHQSGIFEIPNPWDVGSALMLERLGAQALATSSSASAMASGLTDGRLGRDAALAHARLVAAHTQVPVVADLENCFADTPQGVAETMRLASQTGLVGGSIEDFKPHGLDGTGGGLYPFALAVERVHAAVQAARQAPFHFSVTARCENHLRGVQDLDDTIRRLQAYELAGADVLFAPALPDLASIQLVCQSLRKPFNFMVGMKGKSFSRAELAACGVRRISFGAILYRTAMGAAEAATRELLQAGTYSFVAK